MVAVAEAAEPRPYWSLVFLHRFRQCLESFRPSPEAAVGEVAEVAAEEQFHPFHLALYRRNPRRLFHLSRLPLAEEAAEVAVVEAAQ